MVLCVAANKIIPRSIHSWQVSFSLLPSALVFRLVNNSVSVIGHEYYGKAPAEAILLA